VIDNTGQIALRVDVACMHHIKLGAPPAISDVDHVAAANLLRLDRSLGLLRHRAPCRWHG
jgi:hypothetical protein